jgi:hypothetical protein
MNYKKFVKEIVEDEDLCEMVRNQLKGLVKVTIDFIKIWSKNPKAGKEITSNFNNFQKQLNKFINNSPEEKIVKIIFNFTNFPVFKVNLNSPKVLKRILKNKSGQLLRFGKLLICKIEPIQNYKHLAMYHRICECQSQKNAKYRFYSLEETVKNFSDINEARFAFYSIPKCKECHAEYVENTQETLFCKYQRCEVMILEETPSNPFLKQTQIMFLDEGFAGKMTEGKFYDAILSYDIVTKFTKDNCRMVGSIQPYFNAVQLVQIGDDVLFSSLFKFMAHIKQQVSIDNDKSFKLTSVENHPNKSKISIISNFESKFLKFIKFQENLDSIMPGKNFKLNFAVILQMFSKTISSCQTNEPNKYSFNRNIESKNPKASKLNIICKETPKPSLIPEQKFSEGGLNLLIFCDDADFITRTLLKNFNSELPFTEILIFCPKFEIDEQLNQFLIQNTDKIIIMKNPHALTRSCADYLNTALQDGYMVTKNSKIKLQITFIFVIENSSIAVAKKKISKKRQSSGSIDDSNCKTLFKKMDAYLSPDIVNSLFMALDLNFENNEVTFRSEYDNDKYMINEIIQSLNSSKDNHFERNKANLMDNNKQCENFSLFSQISNIFSTISLGNLKEKIQVERLKEDFSEFNLSAQMLDNYFKLRKNIVVDFKQHMLKFEKIIKILAAFKSYFDQSGSKTQDKTGTLDLFDFYLCLYYFEETNLLLHGPSVVNFGNKFPYITFYTKMYFESGKQEHDMKFLKNYANDLFIEIYNSLK